MIFCAYQLLLHRQQVDQILLKFLPATFCYFARPNHGHHETVYLRPEGLMKKMLASKVELEVENTTILMHFITECNVMLHTQ